MPSKRERTLLTILHRNPHVVCVILCLCRAQAEGVSDNINKTKAALETSQRAIKKAEKEMTIALENLKNAQNITNMVNLYYYYYYQC